MWCRLHILVKTIPLFATMILVMIPSGCGLSSSPSGTDLFNVPSPVAGMDTVDILGGQGERRFDFGPVVGDPTRGLSHEFTLTNRTKEPVKIVRVTNGMPCCGEVEPITETELPPGQSLGVKVTIRPSKIGPLRHWVAVTTDRVGQDDIRLVTFAQVHSPVRIEAVDDKVPEVGGGQTFSTRFDLIECFSKDEPTDSRSIVEPSLTVPGRASQARWEGPPRDRPLSGRLMERVRPFSITLTASELSGTDRAELVVAYNPGRRLTQQLTWNVAGFLQFEPAALTIRSGEGVRHARPGKHRRIAFRSR